MFFKKEKYLENVKIYLSVGLNRGCIFFLLQTYNGVSLIIMVIYVPSLSYFSYFQHFIDSMSMNEISENVIILKRIWHLFCKSGTILYDLLFRFLINVHFVRNAPPLLKFLFPITFISYRLRISSCLQVTENYHAHL